MKNNIIPSLLLINFFLLCALLSGCGELRLYSDWREQPIIIDAKFADWGNAQSYYDEKTKVVINLLNDEDYLYICLITRNRQIETDLMETGFVAWFDPDSGNKKAFGIRFPTGLKSMGVSLEEEKGDMTRDWQDQEDKSGLIDREKERWRDKDFNKHLEQLEGLQDKLKIMQGPFDAKDKEKHSKPHLKKNKEGQPREDSLKDIEGPGKALSLEEAAKFGVEAKVGRENGYFVYELKVPLAKSAEHPYAIGVKKNKPIGLGLEISMFGMGRRGESEGGGISSEMEFGMRAKEYFRLWATVVPASR